ncbi:MAG TPA: DegT/DnrJ/EryC1/StrS family aminotransferase [Limnochordia bacterium]
MAIPAFDLTRQWAAIGGAVKEAVAACMAKGQFVLGEEVEALEQEIAALCGVRYGVGVASGSDALHLSLLALEIGRGDEVITTPFTFFATAGAISRTGARPVFVDIDPKTFNLDPQGIEAALTPRTRAIIPVHLYGLPAEMGPITAVARAHGLYVIEDAAQAIAATYRGRPVGSFGDLACFSFYPTKNLGAFGDGGMVVTDDPALAERLRMLRVHGSRRRYYHERLGYNSRLDELQAAILRVKLRYLDAWTDRRRELASRYAEALDGVVETPIEPAECRHVYHQYTVQSDARDELAAHLKALGVGTSIYYPCPLHLQAVYRPLGYAAGDFPAAEAASRRVLSLPMFPELTDDEVAQIAAHVRAFALSRT